VDEQQPQQRPQTWSPIQVPFEGKLPSEIADLSSLEEDFSFTKKCAQAYLNMELLDGKANKESLEVIRQALWSAAAISYRRAFATGRAHLVPQGQRLRVPEHWKDLRPAEGLEAHEKVMKIANRHIAHRVGEHEHINVVALLTPPPMPRGLAGIAAMAMRLSGPEPVLVERLIQLCDLLLKLVRDRSKELGDRLYEARKIRRPQRSLCCRGPASARSRAMTSPDGKRKVPGNV
jgi:hypothetical protein